jgi:hypothetical protein
MAASPRLALGIHASRRAQKSCNCLASNKTPGNLRGRGWEMISRKISAETLQSAWCGGEGSASCNAAE